MELIIFVGNIGTGKTTYRKEHYCNGELIVCTDEWEPMNRRDTDFKIKSIIIEGLKQGRVVVLDGNNLKRNRRSFFNSDLRDTNSTKTIIDFGIGDEASLQRRIESSPEISPEYWRNVHNTNRENYEKPNESECNELIVI